MNTMRCLTLHEYGGKLDLLSEPGQGTAAIIELP